MRVKLHLCRWVVVGVEHIPPAGPIEPGALVYGWTIIKRVCAAGWCRELDTNTQPGTWTIAEAAGVMPWEARSGRQLERVAHGHARPLASAPPSTPVPPPPPARQAMGVSINGDLWQGRESAATGPPWNPAERPPTV